MPSRLERCARIPDTVLIQEVDGEAVLLDLDGEQYYGLNEVGTRIWSLLAEGKTLGEAHGVLCGEYDVAPDVLERDMLELVDGLEEEGLLTFQESGDHDGTPGETT